MDPLAHASIGLMARPAAPKAPLWALLLATQVPDLLFFGFEALGLEHQAETAPLDLSTGLVYLSPAHMPWSHGLVMAVAWSLLAGIPSGLILCDRRAGGVIGLTVFSHWFLDFIVYPNMPVFFTDRPMIGAGLVTSGPGLIAGILLEVILIAGGLAAFIHYRKKQRSNQ
ncbi:MAG: hypothetical protein JXA13_08270 [Anaerolineales bacterium]|nr:hypothetical protein [Anaerolineales bacterium]